MAEPPESTVTVSLMLPVPEAAQLEPDVATQFQVEPDKMTGRVSVTVAPAAVEGPALETTIV